MTARRNRLAAATLLLALASACATAPQPAPSTPAPAPADALVREAMAFMESYAVDLRTGARERIGARYDPRGAYLVGQGHKALVPADSIAARYRAGWSPPASFDWHDLSYEVAGPDAVVVTGRFEWGVDAARRLMFSYTALLVRRDGTLRIRLEDESGAPQPPPAH